MVAVLPVSGRLPLSTPCTSRRAHLVALVGASGVAVAVGALTLTLALPASAQVTVPEPPTPTTEPPPPPTTAPPPPATTEPPPPSTTAPPQTTTAPRRTTTTTARPRTTTTTAPPTTTEAPTTTTSSTSTTAAPAAVVPPGMSTPDGDGNGGGGGGGWSTDTKVKAIVGGLIALAAAFGALAFGFWRTTRPGVLEASEAVVGAAATDASPLGDVAAVDPVGPVPAGADLSIEAMVMAGPVATPAATTPAHVGESISEGAPSIDAGADADDRPITGPIRLVPSSSEAGSPPPVPSVDPNSAPIAPGPALSPAAQLAALFAETEAEAARNQGTDPVDPTGGPAAPPGLIAAPGPTAAPPTQGRGVRILGPVAEDAAMSPAASEPESTARPVSETSADPISDSSSSSPAESSSMSAPSSETASSRPPSAPPVPLDEPTGAFQFPPAEPPRPRPTVPTQATQATPVVITRDDERVPEIVTREDLGLDHESDSSSTQR